MKDRAMSDKQEEVWKCVYENLSKVESKTSTSLIHIRPVRLINANDSSRSSK